METRTVHPRLMEPTQDLMEIRVLQIIFPLKNCDACLLIKKLSMPKFLLTIRSIVKSDKTRKQQNKLEKLRNKQKKKRNFVSKISTKSLQRSMERKFNSSSLFKKTI